MSNLLLAYDADCGSCTRFRHAVEFFDLKNQIDYISLIEADDSGRLDRIPKTERHTTFHLLLPDGEVLSGVAAFPRLIATLPAGTSLAKLVSHVPGGLWFISHLYANFSRAHDGSACRYHSANSSTRHAARARRSSNPRPVDHARSTYLAAGMVGGLIGSFVMGLFVGLPDGLCVALAHALDGTTPGSAFLAWTFHILTGFFVGAVFGYVTGSLRLGNRKSTPRSLVAGLWTGLLVWSGFFVPLTLYFRPGDVTPHTLLASFAAHVALGIVLGIALALALWRSHAREIQVARAHVALERS